MRWAIASAEPRSRSTWLGQIASLLPRTCRFATGPCLTTLVDFHKPGDIEVFIDEASVRYITNGMEREGCLDGRTWRHPSPSSVQQSDLALRGAAGSMERSLRLRCAVLEWTPPHALCDARVVPARALSEQPSRDDDALEVAGQPIALSRITNHSTPWRRRTITLPLARNLPHRQSRDRTEALYLVQFRAYSRHHKSAGLTAQAQLSGRATRTAPNPPKPGTLAPPRQTAVGGRPMSWQRAALRGAGEAKGPRPKPSPVSLRRPAPMGET